MNAFAGIVLVFGLFIIVWVCCGGLTPKARQATRQAQIRRAVRKRLAKPDNSAWEWPSY